MARETLPLLAPVPKCCPNCGHPIKPDWSAMPGYGIGYAGSPIIGGAVDPTKRKDEEAL